MIYPWQYELLERKGKVEHHLWSKEQTRFWGDGRERKPRFEEVCNWCPQVALGAFTYLCTTIWSISLPSALQNSLGTKRSPGVSSAIVSLLLIYLFWLVLEDKLLLMNSAWLQKPATDKRRHSWASLGSCPSPGQELTGDAENPNVKLPLWMPLGAFLFAWRASACFSATAQAPWCHQPHQGQGHSLDQQHQGWAMRESLGLGHMGDAAES